MAAPVPGENLPPREAWEATYYYVTYISQWQRGYFPRLTAYLGRYPPVLTVRIGGVDFARV